MKKECFLCGGTGEEISSESSDITIRCRRCKGSGIDPIQEDEKKEKENEEKKNDSPSFGDDSSFSYTI